MDARRHVRLPGADERFLDGLGCRWETLTDAGLNWVVVYQRPLPVGFVQQATDIAIQLAPGYPPAALDMAYFFPALGLANGRAIPQANHVQQLDGKSWQRWSRHRSAENQWMAGEDDLASHFVYVESWLHDEPGRKH